MQRSERVTPRRELVVSPRDDGRVLPWEQRRTPRTLVSLALWLVFLANGGAIVWLWVEGGNVSGIHDAGSLFNSIGRITGLLAGYLLLVQVVLLVRLTWLERLVGFDRLTVWHRRNGKWTLGLIAAHVVFITIGYAAIDRVSIGNEISLLLSVYPGMVAATIGTGLLVLVVVTSLVIVRRRLRYEAWYLVHLMAYAGIGLAWFHMIPTGNEFITNSRAALYWTALYVATLALLVLFRLALPIFMGWWYGLRVVDVIPESPNVVSLRIAGRHLDRLGAHAGQFFLWRFFTRGRWWEVHPFSLSEAPDGDSLRITVKNVGDFTRNVGKIRPGTAVLAEGPFGVFTDTSRRDGIVLIAGGIGITPIRALLEETPGDAILMYRVVREEDIIFRAELDRLALSRGVRVHYVAGDHTAPGARDLLSATHLRELVPDIAEREIYVCGPPAMADIINKNVRRAGVPRRQIHIERFAL